MEDKDQKKVRAGRKGGKSKSRAKSRAAKANGLSGGRPITNQDARSAARRLKYANR